MANHTNTTPTARPTPAELLDDPGIVTISMSQACQILGISKSTGHQAVKATGFLADGVPVQRVGKRCIISIFHLRAFLGKPDPR